MVRNYVRTSNRGNYSKENLQLAIDSVVSQSLSVYSASKVYGIPESTLQLKVKGWTGRSATKDNPAIGGVSTTISTEEENRIANLLKTMNQWGFGLSKNQVRDSVKEYVINNNLKNHFKDNRPGDDWFSAFCERNKLSLKKAELLEGSRARQANDPFIIYNFFDVLENLIMELGLQDKPDSIYNCDESGFKSDAVSTKIVAEKGKTAQRISHGNGRHQTTVLNCIAASGRKLPPFILHTGKRIQSTFFGKKEYPVTCYFANESGWMDAVFGNWFKNNFLHHIREGPSLLIYDGHNSHVSIEVVEEAIKNNVTLLRLPPHTTHILQPLDVSVFKGMKTRFDVLLHESCRHRLNKILPKSEFSDILGRAWSEVKTEVIIRGFEACGIFPLNRSVINESRFDPNKLKRYKENQEKNIIENQPPNGETGEQIIVINLNNPSTSPLPQACPLLSETPTVEMSQEFEHGERVIKVNVNLDFGFEPLEGFPRFVLGNLTTNNNDYNSNYSQNNLRGVSNNNNSQHLQSPATTVTMEPSENASFESILLQTVVPAPSSAPQKRKRVDVATVCTTADYLNFLKGQEENKKKKQKKTLVPKPKSQGGKGKKANNTVEENTVVKRRGRPKKAAK